MSKHLLNSGLSTYRFKSNPEEECFAKAWDANNQPYGTVGSPSTLAYLLHSDGGSSPREDVTDRERQIAATVIQWLGSPCGQCFLRDLGYVKKQ